MLVQEKDVAATVDEEIRSLLLDYGDEEITAISPSDSILDLGLNSLMLARLVIALETTIGVDPFAESHAISDVRTVEDLSNAYRSALLAAAS